MKQITKTPSPNELLRAYNKFQSHSASLEDLGDCFEWVRFDPRLGEILVKHIECNWQQWNPMQVNRMIRKKEWPTVFAVLCEHVQLLLAKPQKKEFGSWFSCVAADLPIPSPQLFFINLFAFGGKLARAEAFNSLKIYRRWGFYSAHLMLRKTPPQKTLLKKTQRRILLQELLAQKPRVTVNDYMKHLGGHISRRVAELDLHESLKKQGQTKGAVYQKKKKIT